MSKWIEKYNALIWFVGLSLVSIIIYIVDSSSVLWNFLGAVDTAFAVALGVLAFVAYRNMVRDEDEVSLYFKLLNNKKIDTKLTILRKNFTRSEVLGVLGMIQKHPKDRFEIKSLQKIDFLKKLHKLQKGNDKLFFIELIEDEIEQFKTEDI